MIVVDFLAYTLTLLLCFYSAEKPLIARSVLYSRCLYVIFILHSRDTIITCMNLVVIIKCAINSQYSINLKRTAIIGE